MDKITAEQARLLTNKADRGPEIEPYTDALSRNIADTASKGGSQILPWTHLANLRLKSPSHEQRELIKRHFVAAGFKWTDHADPDPGHPASRPYTTISW